jgi:hypothetical protein
MVLVGVLLIAVAAGFTIDVFAQNTANIDVDVLGRTFVVTPGWLVIAGIVALGAFLAGARLVGVGAARARRRRAALRSAQVAAQERDELAEQLAAERAERDRVAQGTDVTPDQTRPSTGRTELGNTASASS